ncbi:anionic trypsin-2-like [Myripristis murdjan]|uniref:anionic trypsin-2-like n=1 Tax=Myripristis murdjan TaxID=586833 RepID=UPI001175E79C|nr:anionic trypsin-2-like [Myripristis murdjan]
MAQLLLLLLLLWADFTVGDVHKRIIGGQTCRHDERRYHVQLRGHNPLTNELTLCGGSLINDQWILTASHCWPRENGWNMFAHLNVHPGPEEVVPIPGNNLIPFTENFLEHDIMLVRLPDLDPQLALTLATIRLPDCVAVSILARPSHPEVNQFRLQAKAPLGHFLMEQEGDSGGGVVYRDQIYGVISSGGCRALEEPIRFMNVCKYKEWIQHTARL